MIVRSYLNCRRLGEWFPLTNTIFLILWPRNKDFHWPPLTSTLYNCIKRPAVWKSRSSGPESKWTRSSIGCAYRWMTGGVKMNENNLRQLRLDEGGQFSPSDINSFFPCTPTQQPRSTILHAHAQWVMILKWPNLWVPKSWSKLFPSLPLIWENCHLEHWRPLS